MKNFAKEVHNIWKTLGKKFDHSFSCENCFSSIKTKRPFIVPGGRFNEFYYWDNLWILHGLLVSEMYETSINTVYNILGGYLNLNKNKNHIIIIKIMIIIILIFCLYKILLLPFRFY